MWREAVSKSSVAWNQAFAICRFPVCSLQETQLKGVHNLRVETQYPGVPQAECRENLFLRFRQPGIRQSLYAGFPYAVCRRRSLWEFCNLGVGRCCFKQFCMLNVERSCFCDFGSLGIVIRYMRIFLMLCVGDAAYGSSVTLVQGDAPSNSFVC